MSPKLSKILPKERLPKRLAIKREKLLLVYAIAAIFILSVGVRLLSGRYGFYMNEFDPYFQYYSTDYIVKSFDQKGFGGLFDYFNWIDKMAWYPEGRNVAASSFSGLHYIGALSYLALRNVFGFTVSLYDYLVLLPVILGGFISIAIFFLGREIDGEAVGIFAGIISAVSPPLISRDAFGWWDTEPIAYLFGILTLLLFISLVEEERVGLSSITKASFAGILLGLSMTIWGGAMYFVGTVGIVFFVALFFVKSYKVLFESTTILFAWNLLVSMMFKKPGYMAFINPSNIIIYVGLLSCLVLIFKQRTSYLITHKDRVYSILLSLLVGLALIGFGTVGGLSMRYLTVLFPFERAEEPIVESVAEHASSTAVEYFAFFSITLFFAGFSIHYVIKKAEFKKMAAVIFAAAALYFAASFGRLMIYMTFSLAVLSGVGILVVVRSLLSEPPQYVVKKRGVRGFSNTNLKMIFVAFLIIMLFFSNTIWIRYADQPVSLATGSIATRTTSSDWIDTLSYIRENTPEDSVIVSWWDYGYWIRVIGNRTTLVDNATLNTTKIALVGKMFMSSEEDAIKIIKDLAPNKRDIYVVVYTVTYQQLQQGLYLIGGGGEESKFPWMVRIAGLNDTLYYDTKTNQPTTYFWEYTLLGKMLPFIPTQIQYGKQVITAYYYNQKIGGNDQYFELVYSSPFSSYAQVLVYKVKTLDI
ncbi:MAG: STT3 domain-containing protein [Nitrososphaeria archaeon]